MRQPTPLALLARRALDSEESGSPQRLLGVLSEVWEVGMGQLVEQLAQYPPEQLSQALADGQRELLYHPLVRFLLWRLWALAGEQPPTLQAYCETLAEVRRLSRLTESGE